MIDSLGKLKIMATVTIIVALFVSSCSNEETEKTDPEGSAETRGDPVIDDEPELSDADRVNALYATLRKLDLAKTKAPPLWRPVKNQDIRSVRSYPEQPPVIPHKIESYQLDRRHNTCLDCHSRVAIGISQAPMVSITHFMDRDGQSLASISPRRYFCNQCHVPQRDVNELVENMFIDVDTMIQAELEADPKKE